MEQEVKTENEQKKEYLRSYKDHVRRVNRISEEIKELREMMMSTKAINYDGMPHGSGGQGDLSGEVARIQGLIDELKRERGLRIMTYQDIAGESRSLDQGMRMMYCSTDISRAWSGMRLQSRCIILKDGY